MQRFDSELRNTAEWEKWQEDASFKYAIEKDGKCYPIKKLISIATGMPVGQFSGGDQANSYIEGYGFKALEINSGVPGIKKSLGLILA
jgi:5-methylcytosine-specific restriction protein A